MIERIPITDRAQWLALRRKDVTASDIGTISGINPFKTALHLWAEKTGSVEETPETATMKRGRWFEPAVVAAVREERPQWQVAKATEYLRDTEARIGATPDAIANDEIRATRFPVQCKVVARPIFDEGWLDGPPVAYQLQALTEAMLLDAPIAYLAALIIDTYSADLQLFPVERHAEAERKIREAVAAFWSDVADGKRPRADYARDLDLLQELHRPRKEIEPLDLSGDNRLHDLLGERQQRKLDKTGAENHLAEIKAEIVEKLQGSPVAICGEWKITNTLYKRAEYIVNASEFAVLRISKVGKQNHE